MDSRKLVAVTAKDGQKAYIPEDRVEAWAKAQKSNAPLSDKEKQFASEIVQRILAQKT